MRDRARRLLTKLGFRSLHADVDFAVTIYCLAGAAFIIYFILAA